MEIEDYEKYSPLSVALAGRDEASRADIYQRFSALPDEVADVLTDTETAEKIASWEKQGIFPPTHSSAVAKLIALSILGIIQPDQIPSLLQKLNLDPVAASQTADAILTIVSPALNFLEGYRQPAESEQQSEVTSLPSMQPLPPLTVRIPPLPENASANSSTRNIIDLRKQPPSA